MKLSEILEWYKEEGLLERLKPVLEGPEFMHAGKYLVYGSLKEFQFMSESRGTVRDLYVLEKLIDKFDLYSVFEQEKDEFILYDAIGSVNIERAGIDKKKLSLYKKGINVSRGNRMLRNVHSIYKESCDEITEAFVLRSWGKIIKTCCGNKSIRGKKYRNGNVIVGGFKPVSHEYIEDCYPCALEDLKGVENSILRGIFYHYLTAFYHPFCDGNGRTSRFLMRNEWSKLKKGLEILPVSYYLYKDVDHYYALFPKVLECFEVFYFVSYFLKLTLYILLHKLVEKGLIEIDSKYQSIIDFMSANDSIGCSAVYALESICNLKEEELNLFFKELSDIGYFMKTDYIYYLIGGEPLE